MTERTFRKEKILMLNDEDAIFMVSPMGNFARSVLELLEQTSCYKALITTSHDPKFHNYFTDIFYLTEADYTNMKSVRGKYGLIYLFDILYNVYQQKYKRKKESM